MKMQYCCKRIYVLSAGEASDARAEAPDGLRTRLMHPPLGPRGTDKRRREETRGSKREAPSANTLMRLWEKRTEIENEVMKMYTD